MPLEVHFSILMTLQKHQRFLSEFRIKTRRKISQKCGYLTFISIYDILLAQESSYYQNFQNNKKEAIAYD